MKRSGGKGGGGVNFNMTLSGGGPYRPFQSQLSCSVRDFSFYVSILFNFPLIKRPVSSMFLDMSLWNEKSADCRAKRNVCQPEPSSVTLSARTCALHFV